MKKKLAKTTVIKGVILYFYDSDHLNAELHTLTDLHQAIRLRNTQEIFTLVNPAFYISGVPYFICVRGYGVSVKLEMLSDKERAKLYEKGYTASENDAWINASYTHYLLRKGMLTPNVVIIFILSIVITALTTFLLTRQLFIME